LTTIGARVFVWWCGEGGANKLFHYERIIHSFIKQNVDLVSSM
jgi:hypothetical protein